MFILPMHYLHQLLHVCMVVVNSSFFGMKRMMHMGDLLDAVGNTHIILVFAHTAVNMEVKPQMEVTL